MAINWASMTQQGIAASWKTNWPKVSCCSLLSELIFQYCDPTTAGTGAEVTSFGTIWDHDSNKKYSVTVLTFIEAILDPELTILFL